MAANRKRISQQKLIEKLRDLDIADEELAKYFIEDQTASGAFRPNLIPIQVQPREWLARWVGADSHSCFARRTYSTPGLPFNSCEGMGRN